MAKSRKINLRRVVAAKFNRQNLYDPNQFLSPKRIDIAAKTIFARSYLENNQSSWPEYVYREHIRAFNNFHEIEPKKDTYAEFRNSFIRTIEGVKNDDSWKQKYPVLHDKDGLINGAHRVAASIVLADKVNAKKDKKTYNEIYNYRYFSQGKVDASAIDESVLDYITIEYTSLKKKNIFVAIIFPTAEGFREEAYDRLARLGEIVNMKTFSHNEFVGKEVIKQLYFNSNNDEWNYGLDFESAQYKADLCFAGTGDLQVYVIEANLDESTRAKEKQYLRNLWKKDKHSIHITDTIEEANRVVRMFFNENSREFMKVNRIQEFASQGMYDLFNEYIRLAPKNILEREKIAIEGSAIMDLYGIRPGKDIDYIARDPKINFHGNKIEKHNSKENTYHSDSIDEILTNPKYYFYYKGYKFITLDELRRYKANRFKVECNQKDADDIKLIDKILLANKNKASVYYPLVSIIVPVYNTPEKYLLPCLNSVAAQVYPNIEVIIVDDGSDAKTAELLDKYAGEQKKSHFHKSWQIIHQKNMGLSGARNTGYTKAKGDYIQFLDADDYFDERLISSAVHRASQTGADIVVENFTIKDYDTGSEYVILANNQLPDTKLFALSDINGKKLNTIPYNVWSKLFKKSFLDANKLKHDPELKRAEDVLFSYSALVNTDKIAFLKFPYIVYRENLPQSNTKNNDRFPTDSIKSWTKLYKYFKKQNIYELYRNDFEHAMLWSFLWHLDRLKTQIGVSTFTKEAQSVISKLDVKKCHQIVRLINLAANDYETYLEFRSLKNVIVQKDKEITKLNLVVKNQAEALFHLDQPGIKTSSRKFAGSIKRRILRDLKRARID